MVPRFWVLTHFIEQRHGVDQRAPPLGQVLRHSPLLPALFADQPVLWEFGVELFVKGIPVRVSQCRSSTQDALSKVVAQQKGVVFCLYRPIALSPRGVNRTNCSHLQKALMPVSWSSVGITTSRSDMQLRNASLPIRISLGVARCQSKRHSAQTLS